MPTYEYECKTCGTKFDVFQSIKARPLRKTDCEHCGTVQKVRRLIGTGGAVIFKGSGFYQTDYRSDGYRKAAKADTDSVSTGSTGSSSKDTPKSSSDKGDSAAAKKDNGSSKEKSSGKKNSPDQKASSTKKTGSSAKGGK